MIFIINDYTLHETDQIRIKRININRETLVASREINFTGKFVFSNSPL